ncbi:phosphatidylinositol-specific phospholipase C domain-containing protein [Litoribacillus peritrichatus]
MYKRPLNKAVAAALAGAVSVGSGLFASNSFADAAIESYLDSWQYRALMLQSEIDKFTPMSEATVLMTHNSYNSNHYANLGSYVDPNQIHSITEQLDMGVRLLELDTHWFSGELTACHGTDTHTGCSEFDGRMEERIGEINTWIRQPEREDQVLFIYFEDHVDGRYAEMSDMIDKYFGDLVYQTKNCGESFPVNVSKADILNSGKQIVIYGGSGGCSGADTSWKNYSFGHLFSTDNSELSGAPDCRNNNFNPSVIGSRITRIYEDSTTLSDWFGDPPKAIDADYMERLVTCGMGVIGLDQLDHDDSRHKAAIWSWNQGEPNDAGGEDCAVQTASGRFNDLSCDASKNYACLDSAGNWQVSSASGVWANGASVCATEFGGTFGVPKNGYQNYLLTQAKGNNEAWINYSDVDQEGKWVPGDAGALNIPAKANPVVYRQLRNGKGKCLDLEGRSTDVGTSVHQWGCHSDPADMDSQLWYQDNQGRLHSKLNSDRCVEVVGNSTGEGTDIELANCDSGANQQWQRSTNNSLRPAHAPHMAMDISGGGNSTDGSDSHIWTYHGGKTQMWYWYTPATYDKWAPDAPAEPGQAVNGSWSGSGGRSVASLNNPLIDLKLDTNATVTLTLVSSVDTYLYLLDANGNQIAVNDDGGDAHRSQITMDLNAGMYMLVAATYDSGKSANFQLTTSAGVVQAFEYQRLKNGKGYCLDIEDEGTSNGSDLHQWSCQSDNYQKWYQDSLGRLHNKAARFKCADVSGAGTGNGSDVHLWSCHTGNNQVWLRSTNNSFRPKHASGKALDIDGGNTWSYRGSDSHIWGYHGGKTQQWVWIN